jgi:hypothetical protein
MTYPFGEAVRDFIFPLAVVSRSPEGLSLQRVVGTGFLVGTRGFGLTAAHVVPQSQSELAAMFVAGGHWVAALVRDAETHPTEDVAVLRLDANPELPGAFSSPFYFRKTWVGSGWDYMLWGYPEEVYFEVLEQRSVDGTVPVRPDLVCSKGYVRRRLSMELPGIRGSGFFEISDPAGSGCSGSPVFGANGWDVVGIYVGERRRENGIAVGYAARIDAFLDWSPKLLGKPVVEEPVIVCR